LFPLERAITVHASESQPRCISANTAKLCLAISRLDFIIQMTKIDKVIELEGRKRHEMAEKGSRRQNSVNRNSLHSPIEPSFRPL